MNQTTIVIHWRGPFQSVEALEGENGLYLLTGKCYYERQEKIQYCGITEGVFYNRLCRHHKLDKITRDLEVWLGTIVYPQNASRYYLEMAEKMLVYFWQPNLNERLRYYPPQGTNLISQWFDPQGKPRYNQLAIYRDLPDVLCWDGDLWRTGNLKVSATL